jgi:hypothetical protein
MRTLILFAMLCPLLQGCVGVVVEKPRTKVIHDPAVWFYSDVTDDIRERNSPEATNTRAYTTECTSEWLKRYWGNPSRVRRVSGTSEEIWTYKFRSAWEGVILFVIVPIPMVLPVGSETMSFTLRDGHVVSASKTESVFVGRTYGCIPNPEGGGSWGVWSWTESWKGVP